MIGASFTSPTRRVGLTMLIVVNYACAALGCERQPSHHLDRPRDATL